MSDKIVLKWLFAALVAISGCNDGETPVANAPTPIVNAAPVAGKAIPNDEKPAKAPSPTTIPQGPGFDFYVLALSWSPAYCSLNGGQADPVQCNSPKPFRFIVHGLWPQYERGYPESCATGGYPTREQIRTINDLTPSPGLVGHEWEKHGTCSGLSPKDYFTVLRAAAAKVEIPTQFGGSGRFALAPQAIESAFVRSNAGLSTGGITTLCDGGLLTEVRICLTKSLEFRNCPEVDRKGCRAKSVTIEPPR